MKQLLRFALVLSFSLVIARGALVQDTHHDYAKWENEISAYERQDATNPPAQGCILFAGSSTIRLWTSLATDYPGLPVVNRGFGGSEIVDSTHFAPRIVFPYAPRMIFFRAGGNDLAAGKSSESVAADFREFAATVHAKLPATKIVFIAWNPTPSRWNLHDKEMKMNQLVADYVAGKSWLEYIETHDLTLGPDGLPRAELFRDDRLHFNAAGYKLLAERVRPYLPKQ